MRRYQLTEAADQDFVAIWNYTAEKWGERQADRYLGLLENCCNNLGKLGFSGQQPLVNYQLLHVVHCEHHYVFFLKRKIPVVVAVLHENMDILARLAARLCGDEL